MVDCATGCIIKSRTIMMVTCLLLAATNYSWVVDHLVLLQTSTTVLSFESSTQLLRSRTASSYRLLGGATTAEKLRGTKVWVLTPGRSLARGRAGGECGRGSPPPAVRVQGYHPGKFLKTKMLNPAFWWLLRSLVGCRGRVYPRSNNTCCEISCFLKSTAKKLGGTNTLLVP